MLTRTIRFFCSQTPAHLREILRKCQTLEQDIGISDEKLSVLRQSVQSEQKKLATRNKQIHQLRSQLTNDVLKGEEIFKNARKKSQLHKQQSITNFAKSMVSLVGALKQAKSLQKQNHDADLKEGFDLTSRLFFSTLEKYKIAQFSPQINSKFSKDEMIVQKQSKAENEKRKGTVIKVVQPGFKVDGKVIHKAKVEIEN